DRGDMFLPRYGIPRDTPASGIAGRAIPHTRLVLTPNRFPTPFQRPSHPPPYDSRSGFHNGRQFVAPDANVRPLRHIIIRRPGDRFRTVDTPRVVYNRDAERVVQVSRMEPPEEIDVGLLATKAENAIGECGITMNKQIWFEAIMMTLGENMTVREASEQIGVNRTVLFRLLNMVRTAMGFAPLQGTLVRQFDEGTVADLERNLSVRRIIRVEPQKEVLPTPEPSVSPMPQERSPTKSADDSLPDCQQSPVDNVYQLSLSSVPSTGREQLKECLLLTKRSSLNAPDQIQFINAKTQDAKSEQTLALEHASIVVTRTVLKEECRANITCENDDDLKLYFKKLLLEMKQDANPSMIDTLATFVANKEAKFDDIAPKEGFQRQIMKTILRIALFQRKLECTQVNLPSEEGDHEVTNEKGTMDENNRAIHHWLSNTVAELSVPITVTDISIVLDLAEGKADRACLKALYRFVAPQVEEDAMMRVKMEMLIMDGYKEGSGVSENNFEFWSNCMESMLTCLLKEYPIYLGKWKSFAEIHRHTQSEAKDAETSYRRGSSRIKARESAVPDSMYLDRVFNRDLKKSLITFLKKLKSSGLPISESTVVSVGEKIVKMMDNKLISKESWAEWVNLVLGVEAANIFEYLDKDY
ncbi:hypothetical protein PMAYCL1PPCAC_18470, partial [Pristionchus mayeri]